MAEIKSAIELAMERTRDLVMDEAEKRESREKEAQSRLKAILRRYLEGMTEEDGAMSEVEAIKSDEPFKKRLFMNLLLDELDITRENHRLVSLMGRVEGNLPGDMMEELESMAKEFAGDMEKREDRVREKVTLRLEEMGIRGDGVEPNVKAWKEWDHAREEEGRAFEGRLKDWKARLSRAMGEG
jgi:hypothetical protein